MCPLNDHQFSLCHRKKLPFAHSDDSIKVLHSFCEWPNQLRQRREATRAFLFFNRPVHSHTLYEWLRVSSSEVCFSFRILLVTNRYYRRKHLFEK